MHNMISFHVIVFLIIIISYESFPLSLLFKLYYYNQHYFHHYCFNFPPLAKGLLLLISISYHYQQRYQHYFQLDHHYCYCNINVNVFLLSLSFTSFFLVSVPISIFGLILVSSFVFLLRFVFTPSSRSLGGASGSAAPPPRKRGRRASRKPADGDLLT